MLLLQGKKCLLISNMVGEGLLGHEYAADVRRDLFLYCLPSQKPPSPVIKSIRYSSTFPGALPLLRWHSDLYISLTVLVQVGQVLQHGILLRGRGICASDSSKSRTAFVSTGCWLYGCLNGTLSMVGNQSVARRFDRSRVCEDFNVRHGDGLRSISV